MPPDGGNPDRHAARRARARDGGFPEAAGANDRDRAALLRSYVDLVILRDVIERHAVSNPLALRWMQRHLLANPGARFSVNRLYADLRSQGLPVSKDTLHAYLGHLEDAFLIRTVSLHTASERQRMVNPRKAYPIDSGLIALYERSGRQNLGHALETVVLLELERRGYASAYVLTREGWEVDFLAVAPGRDALLVQVSADVADEATLGREMRALLAAAAVHPEARPCLITLDSSPPRHEIPPSVRWYSAAEWLIEDSGREVADAAGTHPGALSG